MKDGNRSIFRASAMQRYMRQKEESVLPRLARPRTFIFLWVFAALLVASVFVTWSIRVPVYVSGEAVIVAPMKETDASHDGITLIASLPPDGSRRVRAGQKLFIKVAADGERLVRRITAVEPQIVDAAEVQRRFGIDPCRAQALTQTANALMVELDERPFDKDDGRSFHIDVEVGSHRAVSMLPLIGRFFDERSGETDGPPQLTANSARHPLAAECD